MRTRNTYIKIINNISLFWVEVFINDSVGCVTASPPCALLFLLQRTMNIWTVTQGFEPAICAMHKCM